MLTELPPIFRVVLLVPACLLHLPGCKKSVPADAVNPAGAAQVAVAAGVEQYFPLKVGERTVSVQLAVRTAEMNRGLMYRKTMGADEGMLFVYPVPQKMSFWMHQTELPLDIGFFDGHGILKEVRAMYPHDKASVQSRSSAIKFALEMNQGWFAQREIRPGAQLDLGTLARALRARGFPPGSFGENLEAAERAAP